MTSAAQDMSIATICPFQLDHWVFKLKIECIRDAAMTEGGRKEGQCLGTGRCLFHGGLLKDGPCRICCGGALA